MDPGSRRHRTTRDVVEDHIRCRMEGRLEDDLVRNYSEEVVLVSYEGVNLGHDGVRALARVLHRYLPEAEYRIRHLFAHGEVALELWSARARAGDRRTDDGADSFVVRDGRIVAQTIHYSVTDDRWS